MEKCKYCGETGPHTSECPTQNNDTEPTVEDIESLIDARLEELLLHKYEYFNEGNNGLILKLNLDDISDEALEALKEAGIELGDKQVTKILKIYSAGKGEHEFKMQKKAYEMVEEAIAANDGKSYAKIPRPILFRDLPVSPAVTARLQELSPGMRLEDRAQIIMMDMVDGNDLGEIFFREAHARHPKKDQYPINTHSHADALQFAVSNLLNMEVPERPVTGAGITPEHRKLQMENAKKLYAFLEKSDFRIHPAIIEQIKNTLLLMHKNGMAFRDGHHRNFMAEGDYTVPDVGLGDNAPPQAFLIDFEHSTTFTGELTSDVYQKELIEGGGSYNDDMNVIHTLKPLAQELPERDPITGPQLQMMQDIEKLRQKLFKTETPPKTAEIKARVQKSIEQDKLFLAFTGGEFSPDKIHPIFAALLDLVEDRELEKEQAKEYLKKMLAATNKIFLKNDITMFLKAWK